MAKIEVFGPVGGQLATLTKISDMARPGQASQLLFLALGCNRLFLHDLKVRLQLQLQQEKKTINTSVKLQLQHY